MKGYVNIPGTIFCENCKQCGSRPIIALNNNKDYVVKCPADEAHYQTKPGLIDIEDWNTNNRSVLDNDYDLKTGS